MKQNIKEKVLKEVLGDIEKKADEHQLKECGDPTECHVNLWCYDLSPNIEKAIDLTLAEVSKCSVCKESKPIEFMAIECPDCYLKGMEKEGFILKEKVGKVIDETFKEEFGVNHPEAYLQKELKQKLGIK